MSASLSSRSDVTARRLPRGLVLASPVVLAFAMMLPRVLSPAYGLLDDGQTLVRGTQIWRRWDAVFMFDSDTGRFMPAYWFFYGSVHRLVGTSALGFFIVNALVLAAAALALVVYVRRAGGTDLQAVVSAFVLVLSGSAIESFYTLSKAEPPQFLWLVTAVLLMPPWVGNPRTWTSAAAALAMFLAVLLADVTKETSLAVIPIAWAWVGLAWWRADRADRSRIVAARSVFALTALAAGATFFALRAYSGRPPMTAGSYSGGYRLDAVTIAHSLADWTALLARDFGYLMPLIVFVVGSWIGRRCLPSLVVLDSAAWMAGWMAVYLPWGWTLDYYLLPFTFGCAALGGILLGEVVEAARAGRRLARAAGVITLVLAAMLWLLNVLTQISNARVQLAVDAANSEMVRFMASLPPGSLVIVNFPIEHEYAYEMRLHLAGLQGRPDIVVDSWRDAHEGRPRPAPSYLVTPQLKGQPHPSVRLPFGERSVDYWNARLRDMPRPGSGLVYETRHHVRLLDVGYYRLLCPLIRDWQSPGILCSAERPIVDTRLFSYGWKVYRLSPSAS